MNELANTYAWTFVFYVSYTLSIMQTFIEIIFKDKIFKYHSIYHGWTKLD